MTEKKPQKDFGKTVRDFWGSTWWKTRMRRNQARNEGEGWSFLLFLRGTLGPAAGLDQLSGWCPVLFCRAPTCFHSVSVCCVWVSGSPAAMTVLSEWSNTPTLWFPQHTAKTDWRPSAPFWIQTHLQLGCLVTVYAVTPFKICQLRRRGCQDSSAASMFLHNCVDSVPSLQRSAIFSKRINNESWNLNLNFLKFYW